MPLKTWIPYERLTAGDLNANFAAVIAAGGASKVPVAQVFSGSGTYVKPVAAPLLAYVLVEVLGAGGGGGGTPATISNQECCGGGGGGGGYAAIWLAAAALPASCTVTVGAGGAGGVAGAAGAVGGDSVFTAGAVVVTGMGGGGGFAGAVTSNFYSRPGAGGGNTGGSYGFNGGGGSSHKLAGTVATGVGWGGGTTLTSPFVPTFFGNTGNLLPTGSFGLGGPPASASASTAARDGSNGGNGLVIVTQFYVAAVP